MKLDIEWVLILIVIAFVAGLFVADWQWFQKIGYRP